MAAEADWGICLARTDPAAPKHLGITYFVVDMAATGIDVRPLRELTGLAMFNEVFLDGVFVPDHCVVGEVGGWPLARTTLANERVSMGSGSSFGGGIEALVALVAERVASGALGAGDPLLDRLGALVSEAHAVAAIGLRATALSLSGAPPGPEASVRKLLGVEHDQRTQELGLLLLGPEGATTVGAAGQWTFGFLANRCLTIAGVPARSSATSSASGCWAAPGPRARLSPGATPIRPRASTRGAGRPGSRIMMARPPMSVSASTSPPSSATRAQVAATSATVNDRWVRPGSVNDRDRAASLPSRSKWSSSSTKPSRSR